MKQFLIPIFILFTSIAILFPFFRSGYIASDDGGWAVVRLASMYRELRSEHFPVRWSNDLNQGFGYPLFNFSYPGPYYLGVPFIVFGLSFINTTKLLFVIATIISTLCLAQVSKVLWRSTHAFTLTALVFLTSPYLIINLYQRGSLGETLAFTSFSLALLFGIYALHKKNRMHIFLFSLSIASLILMHNVLALLLLPVISIILGLYAYNQQISSKYFLFLTIIPTMLGLLLTSFFIIPALSEIKYTKLGQTPLTTIYEEFPSTVDLFLYPLIQKQKTEETFTIHIGIIHLLILVLTAIGIITQKSHENRHTVSAMISMIFISLLLMISFTEPLWSRIPILNKVDFPWRIMAIPTLLIPLISPAILKLFPKMVYLLLFVFFTLLIVTSYQIKNTVIHTFYPDALYSTNLATTTSADEYLSIWTKTNPDPPSDNLAKIIHGDKNYVVQKTSDTSSKKEYDVSCSATNCTNADIQIPVMYFPGWKQQKSNALLEPKYNEKGLLVAQIQDTQSIKFIKVSTPVQVISNTLSIAAVSTLLVYIIFYYKIAKSASQ